METHSHTAAIYRTFISVTLLHSPQMQFQGLVSLFFFVSRCFHIKFLHKGNFAGILPPQGPFSQYTLVSFAPAAKPDCFSCELYNEKLLQSWTAQDAETVLLIETQLKVCM